MPRGSANLLRCLKSGACSFGWGRGCLGNCGKNKKQVDLQKSIVFGSIVACKVWCLLPVQNRAMQAWGIDPLVKALFIARVPKVRCLLKAHCFPLLFLVDPENFVKVNA